MSDRSFKERGLKKEGLSQRAIAKNINVHNSTISRELARNKHDNGDYYAQSASISSRLRYQHKSKNRRIKKIHTMYITKHLKEGWSPEQISGRMKLDDIGSLSHETIYKYIYHNQRSGGKLYKYLRHKNKKYTKRSAQHKSRGQIKDRISIDNRPAIVETKKRVGDWEIDLIIGKHHHQAIVTIVDRCSKFTLMKKVYSKQARDVTKATIELMQPIKNHTHTITSDNGKEFSYHKEISQALETSFYFAHPYRSCERGLNEHTNGLIREWFPKDTLFEGIKSSEIIEVQNSLNNRPRKILDYQTPAEVFFDTITKSYSGVALST